MGKSVSKVNGQHEENGYYSYFFKGMFYKVFEHEIRTINRYYRGSK
jgi:hypothetical protein